MRQSDRFAVIGDPISHSLSPVMHNAALSAAGIAGRYEAIRVTEAELGAVVKRLRSGLYCGLNVTIPHKQAIVRHLDKLAPDAAAVGAVNTVVPGDGVVCGYNTDVEGFIESLGLLSFDPIGCSTLVYGAGGAARAVVHGLLTHGAQVTVVARNRQRAGDLAEIGGGRISLVDVSTPLHEQLLHGADLLVNATPLGMRHLPHACVLPEGVHLPNRLTVVDLIYGRETPLLRRAREAGCRAMDGLEMLVRQGAAAFRLWTGTEPNIDAMRGACLGELRKEKACFDS